MSDRVRIIGSYVSPYVRKVLACLHLKGIDYEIDPITPFYGGDEFDRLSPLRRIPVLIHGDLVLCDSSVIAAYVDEAFPGRPLLPPDPKQRARARWLEEYADTRLGDLFVWGLFYQKIVHRLVWGTPGDLERAERTETRDLPREFDYLERELPAVGFLFGDEIGLADITIATFFRNGAYAGFEPDPVRWPLTSAFIARAFDQPCFADLLPFETAQISATPEGRRHALAEAGAPLVERSIATREPRRGVMRL